VDYVPKPFNPATVKARIQTHIKLSRTMKALQDALDRVKLLSGLLPICAHCKKVRDDKGYWSQIEAYIDAHSEVRFSHGICPECKKKLYPALKKTANHNRFIARHNNGTHPTAVQEKSPTNQAISDFVPSTSSPDT